MLVGKKLKDALTCWVGKNKAALHTVVCPGVVLFATIIIVMERLREMGIGYVGLTFCFLFDSTYLSILRPTQQKVVPEGG